MNKYLQLFLTFFKLGAFTFGGGYAMIPLIEREIVDNHGWIDKDEIMDVFAIAQSIPGAIAINTSTLVGFKVKGRIGALCATFGVILPSFLIILAIATFFVGISDQPIVEAIFTGINGAVILLIFFAARKMIINAVKDKITVVLFLATVAIVFFTDISPIILIVVGGCVGAFLYWLTKRKGASQ